MKKKTTAFVKRMRELSARLKPRLLWLSRNPDNGLGNTYVKAKHGKLI